MKQHEKGFTLLEAALALLLFAIFLESLWGFFTNTYIGYVKFQNKTTLSDSARTANDFIRDQIRLATNVEITVTTGTPSAPGPDKVINPGEVASVEGHLKEIKIIIVENDGTTKDSIIRMENNPTSVKGRYKLSYAAGGTSALITDFVEDIQVKREANSDLVTFTCKTNKDGETSNVQQVKQAFIESLAYKEPYP